jgi:hypothetical protein
MHGFALAVLGFGIPTGPVVVPRDVLECPAQSFAMPLRLAPEVQGKVRQIRVFVSQDRGKTWEHYKDYKPAAEKVTYHAPEDGLYWFALQLVFNDGNRDPVEVDDLVPVRKVYVNTEGRTIKVQKSYGELQRENQDLRKTLEELRKKVAALESRDKKK